MNLDEDLRLRWRPSDEQIARADKLLTEPFYASGGVWTIHVLSNKRWGFWDADVVVIPDAPARVFVRREFAWAAVADLAARSFGETGLPTTGGYTWHPKPGEWAVFEDIMSRFPRED